jgi:cytochrome d ubiquinol oxidase subunit I
VLTHDPNGLFPGLTSVPPADRPPVVPVFFGFRIMLAAGFFMIAAALYGAWLLWRGTLFTTRWYLHVVANTWWVGFVAVIAGWIVTETGRQPWIVYGMMRTVDAVSPVKAGSVAATLLLFVVVYAAVFSVGIYYINRLIARGPQERGPEAMGHRPLAVAGTAATGAEG